MNDQRLDLGPAAAAVLSACAAAFLIGLLTVAAQASPAVKGLLNWWPPAGPLTGKTGLPTILWIAAWAGLHGAWRGREVDFGKVWKISLALLALGLLGVFPPVFEAFGH